MELKHMYEIDFAAYLMLLIVPYGIETNLVVSLLLCH